MNNYQADDTSRGEFIMVDYSSGREIQSKTALPRTDILKMHICHHDFSSKEEPVLCPVAFPECVQASLI